MYPRLLESIKSKLKTPRSSFAEKVSKVLSNVVPPVQAYKAVKQIAPQVRQGVSDFITDFPANKAYVQSKIAQKVLPKYTIPSPEQMRKLGETNYPSAGKSLYFDLGGGPTKSMSAELNQYPVAPDTPQARFMEQVKQKVIKTGGFRPAMQRYLSTVPVSTFEPNGQMAGVAQTSIPTPPGTPWEYSYGGGGQPEIGMALAEKANLERLKDNPYTEEVMAHELVHVAPRNLAFKDFEGFFKSVTPKTNPLLHEVGLRYYSNGEPPPNGEEFYATLAGEMGPEVLNIPEIRRFYENIFSQPTKKSNKGIRGTPVYDK